MALRGGATSAFFEPFRYGRSGHTESPTKPSQARALFIGFENFLFSSLAIAFGDWVFPTSLAAVFTQVFLFAVRSKAVLLELLAAAVIALHCLDDHPLT